MEHFKEVAKKYLSDYDYVGTFVGGSGHLGSERLTDITIDSVEETKYQGQKAFKVTATYTTYTETEFEHGPDEDYLYMNTHTITFLVDENMNIIETDKEKKRKEHPPRKKFTG
ncbi:hypothetical protein GF342_01180 [Candidatus Woesearchaeota archaeon]|nr:hypothetical protein [Candidatus Woesearchaeota archaeon]